MNYQEIIKKELEYINKSVEEQRATVRALLKCYDYDTYYNGYAHITGICADFEEYLEKSALLPLSAELWGYELHYDKEPNDTLVIRHKYEIGKSIIMYCFLVGDAERTLEKLTEGKCKIVEKVIKSYETSYTTLSCSF